MSPHELIRRQVARVLLFDGQDRLLLFRVRDPGSPTGDAWWYPPGGGIEPGESPDLAARRELDEETGIENAEMGPVVLELRGVRFQFDGRDYEQDEWYVSGRLPDGKVVTGRAGDLEAAAVAAHRWWPLAELETTTEVVYPEGLAEIVARLLREGPWSATWRSSTAASRRT